MPLETELSPARHKSFGLILCRCFVSLWALFDSGMLRSYHGSPCPFVAIINIVTHLNPGRRIDTKHIFLPRARLVDIRVNLKSSWDPKLSMRNLNRLLRGTVYGSLN